MTPRKGNKKAGCGVHDDRISALPSNVIHFILSKLPINELVRTSILSWKWRYMWNSVSRLEFDDDFFDKYKFPYDPRITDIINQVLLLHNGSVCEFTLHIPADYNMRIGCLRTWIHFLSRRGLKRLWITNNGSDIYEFPPHIFSCQDLIELPLSPNFHGFKSLIELHLFEIRVESSALENLIFTCPCLEELSLLYCSGFECINVSSRSLRILYMEDDKHLKSICLKNAKNLIELTLLVDIHEENFGRSDLIKGLLKLERLCLVANNIKMLTTGSIPGTMRISINTLKYLELREVHFDGTEELLLTFVKGLPNLVEFIVKGDSIAVGPHASHLNELECSSCCLSQLKNVDITVKTVNKNPLTR